MNFNQLLESIGCPFSEHEAQGYMVGLLIQNFKNNIKDRVKLYLKYGTMDSNHHSVVDKYTIVLLGMLTKKTLLPSYENEDSVEKASCVI